MSTHFLREMENVKKRLFELASLVEDRLLKAVSVLQSRDKEVARFVVEGDHEIDEREVELEEECLKVLALYQPVAADLRMVIAVLKINNDLERIADLSTNIAEDVIFMVKGEMIRHTGGKERRDG